ncbi:MAG TPA: hypothetical protein VFN13_12675 [Rudaea sp.]|nr:hypothetical protein [Rudaea sp.]
MARLPRLYLPGCAQHVIQRGNNREACFYDDADYKAYLSFLKDAAAKYRINMVSVIDFVFLDMEPTSCPRLTLKSITLTLLIC